MQVIVKNDDGEVVFGAYTEYGEEEVIGMLAWTWPDKPSYDAAHPQDV